MLLLLVCNTLIQLVEDNTAALLGLLRTVANFFKTLNRQCSFGHLRKNIATHARSAKLKLGGVQP